MSSSYGENLHITIFGQSHAPAIGVTMEGIPSGSVLSLEKLERFLSRRAPGKNSYSSARKEADKPELLCGILDNITCGAPLTAIIRNTDIRPGDYTPLQELPRPGHADFTAEEKYFGAQDPYGGGHFSGRLTAPLCIAGGICLQLLEQQGISVCARILSVGEIRDDEEFTHSVAEKDFPTVSDMQGNLMQKAIEQALLEGDSLGGIIECHILGLPVGLGDPIFGGMENRISTAVFGIPAVKGISFGDGFDSALRKGSQNNDEFLIENGKIRTATNHCGGILGGITDGMPLVFQAAIKPTPSIAKVQQSVNMKNMTPSKLQIHGRHDPCIVPRAVPCVEAAAALAVYDAFLGRQKELSLHSL